VTRIACLHVPLFPLAARLRAEPELMGKAVVVCDGDGAAARVAAPAKEARRFGVRPGMSLAQARGILPDLVARGRDPAAERSAHDALLETACSLSPRVEDAGPDEVYADVGDMGRLFPGADGERDMACLAAAAGERLGLVVWLGVAATKLAARLAAHRPDGPTVVPPGDEAGFLAPLPLARLGLERRLSDTFLRWGVKTLGELAQLPADRVAARLGAAGRAAHRAARGVDPRPLMPVHPARTVDEGMELEWPVVTVEPLLYAVRQALERARDRLAAADLACTLMELELELEPDGRERRGVRLPSPTRDVDALAGLVRLELEARPAKAPVTAFRCVLHPDRPRRGQLTLFGPPELSPDRLAATLGRLAARLGLDNVGSPRTVDGHRPERFASAPFEPPPPPGSRPEPRRGRGLLAVRVLRPPVPLEVIAEEAEGGGDGRYPAAGADAEAAVADGGIRRLVSVSSAPGATPRVQGLVRIASGPWELEDGWWSEAPVARDYWDVELSGGDLYRIYRQRDDGEWFADGLYD